jgi:hypothetical protein
MFKDERAKNVQYEEQNGWPSGVSDELAQSVD